MPCALCRDRRRQPQLRAGPALPYTRSPNIIYRHLIPRAGWGRSKSRAAKSARLGAGRSQSGGRGTRSGPRGSTCPRRRSSPRRGTREPRALQQHTHTHTAGKTIKDERKRRWLKKDGKSGPERAKLANNCETQSKHEARHLDSTLRISEKAYTKRWGRPRARPRLYRPRAVA